MIANAKHNVAMVLNMVSYPFLWVVWLAMFLLSYPLALVLPLFARDTMGELNNGSKVGVGPRLPTWLSMFQTPDNSLAGDATFQIAHDGKSFYWNAVKWLWRNPVYGLFARELPDRVYVAVFGDRFVSDGSHGIAGWYFIRVNGLWHFRLVKKLWPGRCLYVQLGWDLGRFSVPLSGGWSLRCFFLSGPRLAKFR